MLLTALAVNAKTESVKVVKATLDAVSNGGKTLVFNGRQYQYRLDEDKSVYSYAEKHKPAVTGRQLKPGTSYYFELVSDKINVKGNEYKQVRYVATEHPDDEDEFVKNEK